MLFSKALQALVKHPNLGRPTNLSGVFYITVRQYSIFYFISETQDFNVLLVWDDRRDPDELKYAKD
jgi:plasmid stabilization system protein ParE